jgi:hypothetical protein
VPYSDFSEFARGVKDPESAWASLECECATCDSRDISANGPRYFVSQGVCVLSIITGSVNMDEDDSLVRRRSRRSTAGNRCAASSIHLDEG